MKPLPATQALDQFYLEARARLLDLAAILDRVDRGTSVSAATNDPRMNRIRQGLEILLNSSNVRAEQVQQLFSLDYDPNWKLPEPR